MLCVGVVYSLPKTNLMGKLWSVEVRIVPCVQASSGSVRQDWQDFVQDLFQLMGDSTHDCGQPCVLVQESHACAPASAKKAAQCEAKGSGSYPGPVFPYIHP